HVLWRNPDQARPRLTRSRHIGVEGVRTVRPDAPATDSLRDGVGNEEGRNADAGSVQISRRDIEGLSEGGSHAPDTSVAMITTNLHWVPFFDVSGDRRTNANASAQDASIVAPQLRCAPPVSFCLRTQKEDLRFEHDEPDVPVGIQMAWR